MALVKIAMAATVTVQYFSPQARKRHVNNTERLSYGLVAEKSSHDYSSYATSDQKVTTISAGQAANESHQIA